MKNVSMPCSRRYVSREPPKPASTSYSPPRQSSVALRVKIRNQIIPFQDENESNAKNEIVKKIYLVT